MLGRYDEYDDYDWDGQGDDFLEGTLQEKVDRALYAERPTPNQLRLRALVDGLNPEQLEAACYDGTALLVNAGAGTGKTRVLTVRIALLVTAGICMPSEILALTFTNKAAKEMRERIAHALELDAVAVTATTFHAFCNKLLRDYGGEAGWKTDWTILQPENVRRMFRICWRDRHNSPPDNDIVDAIEQAYDTMCVRPNPPLNIRETIPTDIQIAVQDYLDRKVRDNVKDFADLLNDSVRLLHTNEYVRSEIQKRYRYVLVDEYQDTDERQEQLLRLILGNNRHITVVGDEDQLVYTWRYAQIENILGFEQRWDGGNIQLIQNYRSTANILDAANKLIGFNKKRLGKSLYTYGDTGNPIVYEEFQNQFQEAEWIVDSIASDIQSGIPMDEIAVLSRSGRALIFIEQMLNQHGIRYTMSAGSKFQDRQEIKDIGAYLRLTANAHDRTAFERAIATPKRGIGAERIEEIATVAQKLRTDVTDAARRLALGGILPENAREPVLRFTQIIEELGADAIHGGGADTIVDKILDSTGYVADLKAQLAEARATGDQDAIEEKTTRLINIEQLRDIAIGKSVQEFLDHLGLAEDVRRDEGKGVWLGTIHAAKGLEFKNVYLPAWEQGMLPSHQALSSEGGDIEEERRLAYVAITRARENLTITRSAARFDRSSLPSVFLADIGLIERPNFAPAPEPTEEALLAVPF